MAVKQKMNKQHSVYNVSQCNPFFLTGSQFLQREYLYGPLAKHIFVVLVFTQANCKTVELFKFHLNLLVSQRNKSRRMEAVASYCLLIVKLLLGIRRKVFL